MAAAHPAPTGRVAVLPSQPAPAHPKNFLLCPVNQRGACAVLSLCSLPAGWRGSSPTRHPATHQRLGQGAASSSTRGQLPSLVGGQVGYADRGQGGGYGVTPMGNSRSYLSHSTAAGPGGHGSRHVAAARTPPHLTPGSSGGFRANDHHPRHGLNSAGLEPVDLQHVVILPDWFG
jgi:hypothetical protein